jgi:hypothetical protein
VQRIVGRSSMQDQSKWNKVSSGGEEAFLIVGSHSKFSKEGGPSDLSVHLQAGHVAKEHHVADWKVKGMGFPNLLNSRYAKSRNYLSRQFEVCSGPLL